MADAYNVFRVSTNITISIVTIALFCAYEFVLSPFERGFFCDDESIQKPYKINQTVPTSVLAAVSILMMVSVITTCDGFNYLRYSHSIDTRVSEDEDYIKVFSCISIKKWIYRIVGRVLITLFGCMLCLVVTGLGKRMVGRLRPHFIAVCRPDYSKFNCSDGFVTLDVCTSDDESALKEARLSFPSGHASVSAFTVIFTALYIQYAIKPRKLFLLKPFIQFITICLGLACSFTRISDYYHHWSDVLAGFILGCFISVFTIYILLQLPSTEERLSLNRQNRSSPTYVESDVGSALNETQN